MEEHQDIINECWRSISGYINYQVSNIGRIRNAKTGRIKAVRQDKDGYLLVELCQDGTQKGLRIHRLVAQEFLDNHEDKPNVDHIDGVRTNNCVSNLRWASTRENNRNQRKREGKSSRFKGVSWITRDVIWQSGIKHNGKSMNLGRFNHEKDAARAYNEKALELFGEFACLNEISDSETEA
jgi:hypothetical protein